MKHHLLTIGLLLAGCTAAWSAVIAQNSRHENPTPQSNELMGSSLASGLGWFAAGAPRDTTWGTYSGEVSVFPWSESAGWGTPFSITEPTLGNFAYYGASVAGDEDRLVVGCPGCAITSPRVGAVWLYDVNPSSSSASYITMLSPGTLSNGDDFGRSVAIDDQYLAVGAPEYNGTGAVWIYEIDSTNNWIVHMVLQPTSLVSGAEFGYAVAMDQGRLVIGAPGHSAGGNDAGRVYVYDLINTTWTTWSANGTFDGPTGSRLGEAVDVSGYRVVAGAPEEVTGLAMTGRVHRYAWGSRTQTWTIDPSLEGSGTGDRFGEAVSCGGYRTLVGAPGDQANGWDSGRCYYFNHALELAVFDDALGNGHDEVGAAVHWNGAFALAGAPGAAAGSNQTGGVLIEWETLGTPGCQADQDGDLDVDGDDLVLFLKSLTVYPTTATVSDLDGSGLVDIVDLILLMEAWGSCP